METVFKQLPFNGQPNGLSGSVPDMTLPAHRMNMDWGVSLDELGHAAEANEQQPASVQPLVALDSGHYLRFPWPFIEFPRDPSLPLPHGWTLLPEEDVVDVCLAPLIYHKAPLGWLSLQARNGIVPSSLYQTQWIDTSAYPADWHSPEFLHDLLIAIVFMQEILSTPFWPAIDACVNPDEADIIAPTRIVGLPSAAHLMALHRNQSLRPLVGRIPLERFRMSDSGALIECFLRSAISFLHFNCPHVICEWLSPWSILSDDFINNFGIGILREIRQDLTTAQLLNPVSVLFEMPEVFPGSEERVGRLRACLAPLGLMETISPLEAHIIIPVKPLEGLKMKENDYITGGIVQRFMDGTFRSNVPMLSQALDLGFPTDSQNLPLITSRPLDGGIVFATDGLSYHAVGTPISWDITFDGSLDSVARKDIPPPYTPETVHSIISGTGIRLAESFLLVGFDCNEVLSPCDFGYDTDAVRLWSRAIEASVMPNNTTDIPQELIGFIPELAETVGVGNYSPVSLWMDITVGPSAASPAFGQIVRISRALDEMGKNRKVAELVGNYAIPILSQVIGCSQQAQHIAQHLTEWLIYVLSNPTEHEQIVAATDPVAQQVILIQNAKAQNIPCITASIHPSVLLPYKRQYSQLRNALQSILVKIAGNGTLDAVKHQLNQNAARLATGTQSKTEGSNSNFCDVTSNASQQLGTGNNSAPNMNIGMNQGGAVGVPSQGQQQPHVNTAKRVGNEYFQRMDAENKMMSFATLYLDVPRRSADGYQPDFSVLNAPVLPVTSSEQSDLSLPVTIPDGLFPDRFSGATTVTSGIWGRTSCFGCDGAFGPLLNLIDPVGDGTEISVQQMLDGQRRLIKPVALVTPVNQEKEEPVVGHRIDGSHRAERGDLCTLKVADWYNSGIIQETEWKEMHSVLQPQPTTLLRQHMAKFVNAHQMKHKSSELEANRAMFEFMGRTRPNWKEYIRVRDGIIRYYREDPKRYLTVSDCRRQIWGNGVTVLKIHAFLEFYGLINLQATIVPGGLKGAQFRPLASGISSYSKSRLPSSLPEQRWKALFCASCSRVQLGRVFHQRNHTDRHGAVRCVSCIATGRVPKNCAVEEFVPLELNPRGGKSFEVVASILQGWTIDELELMMSAVEQMGDEELISERFWTSVSASLRNAKITENYKYTPDLDLAMDESPENRNDLFRLQVATLARGQPIDPKALARREPQYCILAFLCSSRVTHVK